MPRSRKSHDGLPGRVYPKHGAWYFVAVTPQGKAKWEKLCRIDEGKTKIFERLGEVLGQGKPGNMPRWIDEYKRTQLKSLAATTKKAYEAYLDVIADSFEEFDVQAVEPADIAEFLEDYEDRPRTAQSYRGLFTSFFIWCCAPKQRLRKDNPTREMSTNRARARATSPTRSITRFAKRCSWEVPAHEHSPAR
jgi:predicted helicase